MLAKLVRPRVKGLDQAAKSLYRKVLIANGQIRYIWGFLIIFKASP